MKFWYIYLIILLPWFSILFKNRKKKKIIKSIIRKREKGNSEKMKTLLSGFIGKQCIINLLTETHIYDVFTVKAIEDNGLLCEKKDGTTAIFNIEYICYVEEIKEKPKKNK